MSDVPLFNYDVDPDELDSIIGDKNFIICNHSLISDKYKLENGGNLIMAARRDDAANTTIRSLANRGFLVYKAADGQSTLIRHRRIPTHWKAVLDGECKHDNGIYYEVAYPELKPTKAIFMFSSISTSPYQSGYARMFFKNFRSISKHVPPETLIVRIADMGGVVGAYYSNTNFLRDNEDRIGRAIGRVLAEHGIAKDDACLFGVSKGATGALLHGLLLGMPFVAIEPVVSDEYYIQKYRDSHFTVGVFPERKEVKFSRLMNMPIKIHENSAIVYSDRSPQFSAINEVIRDTDAGSRIHFLDSHHPLIKDHPDVAPNALVAATMLLNMALYRFPLGGKNYRVIV